LVYAFILKAASIGSVWLGGLCMAAFGLGTVPLMVATGCGGGFLSIAARARVLKLAALCVVLAGTVTIVRGAYQLGGDDGANVASCPFCAP
jgi:sulfite exporter TauE/SafE